MPKTFNMKERDHRLITYQDWQLAKALEVHPINLRKFVELEVDPAGYPNDFDVGEGLFARAQGYYEGRWGFPRGGFTRQKWAILKSYAETSPREDGAYFIGELVAFGTPNHSGDYNVDKLKFQFVRALLPEIRDPFRLAIKASRAKWV